MMDNNSLSRWRDVFYFTFMQQVKSKAFKIVTILIGAIVLIAVFLILVLSGRSQEDKELQGIDNIQDVYILDETKDFNEITLFIDSFNEFGEVHPDFKNITFMLMDGEKAVSEGMSEIENINDALLINITRNEEGILVKALLPEETYITTEETELLLENLQVIFETYKMGQSGLSGEQLSVLLTPITASFTIAGEETPSLGQELVKYLVPMIYSFVLYILLIVYAQSIMNNLLIEKTSKLTEMLLTTVSPRMVITGKILGMAFVAIMQFLFWILCGITGFVMGDFFLSSQYQDYRNPLVDIIRLVQENSNGPAFSLLAIILSLVALILGFLFYFSFAGLVGASLGKAEDISNGTALFYLPVIIFGMVSMMSPMLEGSFWKEFMNYFPFSSPFLLATNILNGNVGTASGIISIGILVISIIIWFILAGKLYKGLIFFKGEKLTIANVIKVIKETY